MSWILIIVVVVGICFVCGAINESVENEKKTKDEEKKERAEKLANDDFEKLSLKLISRSCPKCAETIKKRASLCVHCVSIVCPLWQQC